MTLNHGELKKDYAYRRILEMISSGRVTDGRFPSEPEFCKELNVSRVTLRAALKRLEKEGLITRSHYYGTRVSTGKPTKKILIASSVFTNRYCDRKMLELQYIEAACRKQKVLYDTYSLFFLQDPEILAEKYCGIIFSGAAIRGDELFVDVIRRSGLPAVYCREDEMNTITDTFPSVGVNMNKAWRTGFDYLVSLGFRRIMVMLSDDARSRQRLGITKPEFSAELRKRGLREAAQMICNIPDFQDGKHISELIRELDPEAIYCYSDYSAVLLYQYLRDMGKKVPQDIAVMGFSCGSDLVTPSLSSVSLVPPIFGTAAVDLLQRLSEKTMSPPPQLELPFNIYAADSTAKINLNNLMRPGSGYPGTEPRSGDRRQIKRKE